MSRDITKIVWEAAAEKKAKELVFIDMNGQSDLCDWQIICSGDTDKHTRAISDAIETSVKAEIKVSPSAIEGRGSGHWVLLDFGALMVHIFMSEYRDYYALESLWPNAGHELPEG